MVSWVMQGGLFVEWYEVFCWFQVPILVIVGERDGVFILEGVRWGSAVFGAVECCLMVVEDAGYNDLWVGICAVIYVYLVIINWVYEYV